MDVIVEDVSGQGQQGFRGNAVGVVKRFGHVVGDIHVQRASGAVAIAVGGDHGELFAEIVLAVAGRVGLVAVEGVAVADRAGRRVVTGDGQGVAQLRGDRLGKADRHAANNHVDAADAQAVQTIRCRDREVATLRQRAWIGRCTVRQIGFIEVQLAIRPIEAVEDDRVVHWWQWHHDRRWRVVAIVDVRVATIFGKLGNAIEASGGETDDRIDSAADFGEQNEAVPAAQFTGIAGGRVGAGGSGFGSFAWVFTGGDGLLDLLDIGQLRLARGLRFVDVHRHRLVGQQLPGHGDAAAPAEGQFLAVLQFHCHRAFRAGDQLIASVQTIAFEQRTLDAVARLGEHLTNDFCDRTDERCHVKSSAADHRRHWFAKQPMAQSGCRGRRSHPRQFVSQARFEVNCQRYQALANPVQSIDPLALRNGGESPE